MKAEIFRAWEITDLVQKHEMNSDTCFIKAQPDTVTISRKSVKHLLAMIEEYRMDVLEHRDNNAYNTLDKAIEPIEEALTSTNTSPGGES